MVGSGPNWEKSVGSQRHDQFLNLEWRRDREVCVHTTYTSRSQSRGGSHPSHKENTRSMQLEIDHLHRRLHRKWRKRTPLDSDPSSNEDRDNSYRPRSRIPPSKSFWCQEEHHYKRINTSPPRNGLENDAMSKALNQISKSPFTCRIEWGPDE